MKGFSSLLSIVATVTELEQLIEQRQLLFLLSQAISSALLPAEFGVINIVVYKYSDLADGLNQSFTKFLAFWYSVFGHEKTAKFLNIFPGQGQGGQRPFETFQNILLNVNRVSMNGWEGEVQSKNRTISAICGQIAVESIFIKLGSSRPSAAGPYAFYPKIEGLTFPYSQSQTNRQPNVLI